LDLNPGLTPCKWAWKVKGKIHGDTHTHISIDDGMHCIEIAGTNAVVNQLQNVFYFLPCAIFLVYSHTKPLSAFWFEKVVCVYKESKEHVLSPQVCTYPSY